MNRCGSNSRGRRRGFTLIEVLAAMLLIVLVLHVVAVAGIIAFNTIKPRQISAPAASATSSPATAIVPSAASTQKQATHSVEANGSAPSVTHSP